MTDVVDLTGYLTSKGLTVHRAHGAEVTVQCMFDCPSGHGGAKGKGKLYLNTESWLYECKVCMAAGNRKTLLDHFGDEDTLTEPGNPLLRRQIIGEAAQLAHELLLANDKMLMYLMGRGLTEETILKRKYGYVPPNVGLTDMLPSRESYTFKDLLNAGLVTISGSEYFNRSILIPYWSHGQVVSLREKQPDGKYRSLPGDPVRLYNADALAGAEDVFVTEGEFDCDIVEQSLHSSGSPRLMRTAVVGMAGTGAWPDGLIDYFSGAKRVFIGFDPDTAGKRAADKLAKLLEPRARVITGLPEVLPKVDWSDYLAPRTETKPHGGHTWRDVQRLMTEADLAGKRMFSVSDASVKFDHLAANQAGVKLGFPTLDAILKPGLLPGQVAIPLAKTSAGKSVWLSNVAHNVCSRYRVLYVSQELMATQVFDHFRRIHHFWFPEATPDERDLYYANLRIVDQNRIGKGDLNTLIEEFTEDVGAKPDVVLVDYLQYLARGFRGTNQHERVNDAVMELKAVAKDEELRIICPSQVSRGAEHGKPLTLDDARDSGVIEETGDFVLSLYRPEQVMTREEGTQPQIASGGFNLGVLKSRHGGAGRVVNHRMSLLSLVIADTLNRNACLRIDQENALVRRGVHYEDWRRQAQGEVAQRSLL